MDFFKLSKVEYTNYLASVRNLMAENGFKHEGVAFLVVSGLPELESLVKQKVLTVNDFLSGGGKVEACAGGVETGRSGAGNEGIYRKFCDEYRRVESVFIERVRMFFDRCVGDEIVFFTLLRTFGTVEEYVSRFVQLDENLFNEAYKKTINGNFNNNIEVFAKLLDSETFDVKHEVEECRKSCYY
jgi:hypothetical protein